MRMRMVFSSRRSSWRTPLVLTLVLLLFSTIRPLDSFQIKLFPFSTLSLHQPSKTRKLSPISPTLFSSSNNDIPTKEQEEYDNVSSSSSTSSSPDLPNTGTSKMKASLEDPLFRALTRMDEATATAKTIQVPLWGDLILDRSLFLLLPIAAFGLAGILLSVFILIHSTDEFVTTAIQESASSITAPGDASSCRGLCTNPTNFDGLRQYMMGITGKYNK